MVATNAIQIAEMATKATVEGSITTGGTTRSTGAEEKGLSKFKEDVVVLEKSDLSAERNLEKNAQLPYAKVKVVLAMHSLSELDLGYIVMIISANALSDSFWFTLRVVYQNNNIDIIIYWRHDADAQSHRCFG